MNKFCTAFIAMLFCTFLFGPAARAALGEEKNLRGRLGVGFTNQVATTADSTIPALSAKYYMSRLTAVSLATGFDTRSANSTLGLGLKIYKNVFLESNLVFYLGGGMAYVNRLGRKFQ